MERVLLHVEMLHYLKNKFLSPPTGVVRGRMRNSLTMLSASEQKSGFDI
jgi:hypothetical protein